MKSLVFPGLLCLALFTATALPATFDDLSSQAGAARQANDLPRAIDLYKQALVANPAWQEGWWSLGNLLYQTDQYASGRDALRQLIALDPNSGPAWGILGLCEFETRDYSQSLADTQRGLSLGIGERLQMEGVLRYHEALLLTRAGQFEKALHSYAKFVPKAVPNPALLTAIGLAALRNPMLPKDIAPQQVDLFATAGRAALLTMNGNPTAAQSVLADLLNRYPSAANVHYFYGSFLLAASPEQGIAELKKELEINPSNGAANAMIAWALLRASEYASALPYASRATHQEPTSAIAQFVYGRALVETGDLKQGIEHLQLAEKIDPANLEHHLALATAYSKASRLLDARRERQQSMQIARETSNIARP